MLNKAKSVRTLCVSFVRYASTGKIGFIGLGNMGGHMAINLKTKGQDVIAYDVNTTKLKELETTFGLTPASSVEELAKASDVVITMLPNSSHVKETLVNGGIFRHLKKGGLIIDSSTISPLVSIELNKLAAEQNLNFVDAPVSGGVMAAKNAKLTFMVGTAKQEIFEKCKQILSHMGANVISCGSPGGGQIAKICNNMALGIEMLAISEALSLGKKLGLDPKILSEVMKVSSARCWSLEVYNPAPGILPDVPSSRNYEGGFAVELMHKDLTISQEVAKNIGANTPLGNKTTSIYKELIEKGLNKKDFSIIYDELLKEGKK